MQFEENYWYHVYNRGNNRQRIYFTPENYLFFIRKIRKQILPLANVIAYCLMPNHFHWLLEVKPHHRSARCSCGLTGDKEYKRAGRKNSARPTNTSRPARWACGSAGKEGNQPHRAGGINSRRPEIHPLVHKIGTLQSSYAQAINKQQSRTGSLFQSKTKAKNLSEGDRSYAETCFHYIHQNPVKAGLVEQQGDWKYSSYLDYAGMRNGTLPAKALGFEVFSLINEQHFIEQSQQTLDTERVEKIF